MSQRTLMVCDGCGKEIESGKPCVMVQLVGVTFDPGYGTEPTQHVHGMACLTLWQTKLPDNLKKQLK